MQGVFPIYVDVGSSTRGKYAKPCCHANVMLCRGQVFCPVLCKVVQVGVGLCCFLLGSVNLNICVMCCVELLSTSKCPLGKPSLKCLMSFDTPVS